MQIESVGENILLIMRKKSTISRVKEKKEQRSRKTKESGFKVHSTKKETDKS